MGEELWNNWAQSALFNPTDNTKCCDRCGIYGLDGNLWGQSGGLNIPPAEVQAAIAALKTGGTIKMNDVKYFVLRTEGDCLMAKAQNKGFTIAKGKQCVLIGLYDNHVTVAPGNNCKRVCDVKDLLVNHGY